MTMHHQTLADCQIPQPVPSASSLIASASSRSLRRLLLSTSVLSKSDGSALVELGHTKVLCSVHGPRSAASSSLTGGRANFNAGGTINCEVRLAPSFGLHAQTAVSSAVASLDGSAAMTSRSTSAATSLEEIELSKGLITAVSPAVRLDRYPKSVVDVFVLVLQSDGSVLPAAITAASLALADAGIEMFDLVSSCGIALVGTSNDRSGDGDSIGDSSNDGLKDIVLVADPSLSEIVQSSGEVTLAVMPNWREATFWEHTGKVPATISAEGIELARDGCATVYKFMRECLVTGKSTAEIQ